MADQVPASGSLRVDFEPVGRRTEVRAGQTLLGAAQAAGVSLVAICGGAGSCGGCRVRLIRGQLSPPTQVEEQQLSAEERASGLRLACQAVPLSDVKLDVPAESLSAPQRLQLEGVAVGVEMDPVVVPCEVQLDSPSLSDLQADAERLQVAVERLGRAPPVIGLPVLTGLSEVLRAQAWSARLALRQGEVVAVLPGASPLFGLAIDIGTTKLAAYLVDLSSGEAVAKAGAMNPQIAYGEDVVSRIAYADQHADGREVLQGKLIAALNDLAGALCAEAGVGQDRVVEAVVVGNTAMHHLFAGLPVRQLGRSPYVPAVSHALEVRAQDLGLSLARGAYVYLPPNIAGYVGADHVAMLLACGLDEADQTTMALDIGTNTEITLADEGRLMSCSCASGPAFEGAHIRDGMRAAPGAVERVQIEAEAVRVHSIDNLAPVGICGSGILDAVAEMRGAGILDRRGALQEGHPRVRSRDGQLEFVLVPAADTGHQRDIVVTRRDVNEIQLAKAAIRAGMEVLLAQAGIAGDDVDALIIAGAFGTYLDVGSAMRVGMFPDLPRARFRQVGNAAGMGARQMLVSAARRRAGEGIVPRIEYVELTTHTGFTAQFLKAMYL